MTRYGLLGSEVDFLEPDPGGRVKNLPAYVGPKVTDELFAYVNDAVLALPRKYQWLYKDNAGCILHQAVEVALRTDVGTWWTA